MKTKSIYLVAHYFAKPKNPAKTHIPGYMKNPENVRYDEQVHISTKLRPKDVTGAKIIMDLSKKHVQTNVFNGKKDFDELFKYFFTGYHKYITDVMVQLDAEYFNKMLDEMQAEVKDEEAQAQ